MPYLYNRHKDGRPKGAIPIERGTIWGNQFSEGSRKEKVRRHKELVLSSPEMRQQIRFHLAGKDLVCCCAPAECHGEILIVVANNDDETLRSRGLLPPN